MIHLGIIGHFAGTKDSADGQTVKTRTLADGLREQYGDQFRIHQVDTWNMKHRPFRFAWELGYCLTHCSEIILIVSKKGRIVFFPLLYHALKLRRVPVFHFAIGGRLTDELVERPNFRRYISSFAENWMESTAQVIRLREMGITNAEYIPNFKRLDPVMQDAHPLVAEPGILHCCTFSRVMREKGISDAMDAVAKLNEKYGQKRIQLDMFGEINPAYRQEFEERCTRFDSCVEYRGVLPYTQSAKVLQGYDLLLFPTHYRREGTPGTVIDAFAAGVPVLARCWQYGTEMIRHGENGFLYDFDKPEELVQWLDYCVQHMQELHAMRQSCMDSSFEYSEARVLPMIREKLMQYEN